ncbi:MAG TPA: carbohydrate ABC transporter permease [Limnochordia bacterium]
MIERIPLPNRWAGSWRAQAAALRRQLARWRHRWPRLVRWVITYVLLIDGAFIFLYPIIWVASTSLKTAVDFLDESIRWIPIHFHWQNYVEVLEPMRFWEALQNTGTIAATAVVAQVVSSALVGYGFARLRFPGKNLLFTLVVLSMVIPPQSIVIPRYIIYRVLGWIDTLYPFIVPSFFGFGLYGALFIFLFRQVFSGFPYELDDAARIDGAGVFNTFWRIFLPLAKPAVVTVALFSFVWNWNDYYGQSIFLNQQRTLSTALASFTGTREMFETGGFAEVYPHIMAATALTMLPCVLLYVFAQRYFLESIERAGLKG